MTVLHVAPRGPAKTGVVDYAESLHRALDRFGDIRWSGEGSVRLYHIGNNSLHAGIYQQAIQTPGIVILHDAVLQHLLLGLCSEAEYIEELVFNYGEWNRGLALQLWRQRARSGADSRYFAYPMLRRLATRSLAVVVHNGRAAEIVRKHAPDARIVIIPHLVEIVQPDPVAAERLKSKLGPGPIFGVFGHLRESKRLASVLNAVRQIPRGKVLLSGAFVSSQYEHAMEPDLCTDRIIRMPFGTEEEFWQRASAIDVFVNLRAPSAGETSGISIRAMALGKPVIVSASSEGRDFPPGSCAVVDEGPAEVEGLSTMMQWLGESPCDREAMGKVARRHIDEYHSPHRVAAKFWDLIRAVVTCFVLLVSAAGATLRPLSIPMRDGVQLSAQIHLPSGSGRYPVLLVRTPYGKANSVVAFQQFIERGYALVVQDVRGRYASGGKFEPLTQEINDSEDTLRWIEKQPWSNGKTGMLGGSYLGLTQWKAASTGVASLKAIFPIHAGIDEYFDRFYARGGAFRLGHRVLWLEENLRAANFKAVFEKYVLHVPLRTIDIVATGGRIPMLQQALDHPSYDKFWTEISVRDNLLHATIPPAFLVGGWYDPNVQSDLEWFSVLQKMSPQHRIVVGPWAHSMSAPFPGIDFGPDSKFAVRPTQIAWFEQHLKDGPDPKTSPVRIFVMGINRWRDEPEWPLRRATPTKFFLAAGGQLRPSASKDAIAAYVYNPRHPAPTLGGAACCNPKIFRWGPMDQRPVEQRSDVLVYSTPPLKKNLEVTGVIRAQLYVSSSAPDTDFTAKLVDVFPSGEVRNLTDGILRLRYRDGLESPKLAIPGETYTISIDAGVTSNVFLAGHQIRVEISSSNFPKYDRNPNTGRPIADESQLITAKQTIRMGRQYPSHLLLPVVSSN